MRVGNKIGERLTGSFILIATITTVVGFAGYYGMRKIKAKQKEFVQVQLKALSAVVLDLGSISVC